MISYLQKFNDLDVELKEKVSGPKVMEEMKVLEGKYRVNLATVMMRVMVQDISILDLSKFFMFEYEMEARHAEQLVADMKKTVFKDVAEHVGFSLDSIPSLGESGINDLDTWKNRQQKPSVKTSDFFFSTEDETEVRDLAKKLETFKTEKREKGEDIETMQNVEEIVAAVVKQINLSFSSNELSSRFVKIVNTYVKNVRSKIDTKETLMKDVESGGMDLNDDLSIRVMSVIDQVKEEYKDKKPVVKPKKIQLPEDVPSISTSAISSKNGSDEGDDIEEESKKTSGMISARDVDYDFGKLKKTPLRQDVSGSVEAPSGDEKKSAVISSVKEVYNDDTNDEEKEDEEKEDEEKGSLSYEDVTGEDALHLSSSKKNVSETSGEKVSDLNEVNLRAVSNDSAKIASGVKMNKHTINNGAVETSTGKVKMEDVKFVPKLVGPIDELNDMSLEDWRRLGNSPGEFTDKIIEKIDFLEKESYKKRLAGIKAWRQSPVNLAYLEIGQNSMIHSRSLSEAISDIISLGKETLNLSEFNAVMDLNKKLRF